MLLLIFRFFILSLLERHLLEGSGLEGARQRTWRYAALSTRLRAIASWSADGTGLNRVNGVRSGNLLSKKLMLESVDNILPLDSFNFVLHVCINEFLYANEAAANTDEDLITPFNLDVDASLPKFVDTLRFSQEENLHSLSLWIPIQELGHGHVNRITRFPDVDCLVFGKLFAL